MIHPLTVIAGVVPARVGIVMFIVMFCAVKFAKINTDQIMAVKIS